MYGGYQQAQQPAPLQQAPAPYIPQQAGPPAWLLPGPQQPQRPMAAGTGYEAMRPAAPRPAPGSVPGPVQQPAVPRVLRS